MSGTKPTPGVTITLTGDASDSVVTDANGEFSFDLPDGSYVLTPSLAGHQFSPASASVEVSGADDTGNDFTAEGIYTISGTVTGDEVEGVTITLTGDASDSTTTAADGTYSFSGLVDGSYNVEPSLEGYTFTPTDTDVTISGADDTDTDFVSASAYITLPQTIDFSDSVNDYWGNATKFIRYNNLNAVGTDDNVDPPQVGINTQLAATSITGLAERAARIISNHPTTIIYAGGAIRAPSEGQTKVFDPSNGIRLQWVAGNEGSTGASYRGMSTIIGLTRLDAPLTDETFGGPTVYLGGQLYTHDVNDARMYLNYRLPGGENTYLGTYGLTGFSLKDSQAWVTCRLEVPANYSGNLTLSFKVHGKNAPNTGSYTQACPDLGGLLFDAPYLYKRCGGTLNYGYAFAHACWIGTLSDAWPWGEF